MLHRLLAPQRMPSLDVEVTAEEFSKLSLALGDVMNPGDDLVVLEDVSESTILHSLRLRLDKDQIFTGIGPVLVVVNPYRPVECCSDKSLSDLTDKYMKSGQMTKLTPHVHTIVANAFAGVPQAS